jgi:hypothetical protein
MTTEGATKSVEVIFELEHDLFYDVPSKQNENDGLRKSFLRSSSLVREEGPEEIVS